MLKEIEEILIRGKIVEVTNAMVYAAVKQAVKDRILPEYADEVTYMHNYESVAHD
jgi:hypothetical protein